MRVHTRASCPAITHIYPAIAHGYPGLRSWTALWFQVLLFVVFFLFVVEFIVLVVYVVRPPPSAPLCLGVLF